MDSSVEYFIKQNLDLIKENTPEAWDQIYRKYPPNSFTQILLDARINPAQIMEYIPKNYLAHNNSVRNFSIPNNCKYIDNGGFAFCSHLESINIPESVTSIGDNVFDSCYKLSNINIPKNIVSIGNMCFYICQSLTKIQLPDTLSTIGYRAFEACHNLEDVILGDGIVIIGESAFRDCTKLTQIKYKGTKSGFAKVLYNSNNPLSQSQIRKIICSDGTWEL